MKSSLADMRVKKVIGKIARLIPKVLRERFIKLVILPTIVLAMVVVILIYWPVATPIDLRLMTERVEFVSAAASPRPILNQARAQSVAFMKFGKLLLVPQNIEVANPNLYSLASDSYPDSAWTRLDTTGREVTIIGAEDVRNPTVTLEEANHGTGNLVHLDSIAANAGSRIILEVVDGTSSSQVDKPSSDGSGNLGTVDVALRIDQPEIFHTLSVRGPVQLTADHCQVIGLNSNPYSESASNTYRVSLSSSSPLVQVTGKDGTVVLFMRLPANEAEQLFYDGVITATDIKFVQEDAQAQHIGTALVKNWENRIVYPGYKKEPVTFTAPDFLELDERDQMSIKRITVNSKHKGFEIDLVGTANHLRVGTPGHSMDLRMSAFDKVWENKVFAILFAIVCWSSGMILAVRKAFREVEGKEKEP